MALVKRNNMAPLAFTIAIISLAGSVNGVPGLGASRGDETALPTLSPRKAKEYHADALPPGAQRRLGSALFVQPLWGLLGGLPDFVALKPTPCPSPERGVRVGRLQKDKAKGVREPMSQILHQMYLRRQQTRPHALIFP